jgi:hypothetical protein
MPWALHFSTFFAVQLRLWFLKRVSGFPYYKVELV